MALDGVYLSFLAKEIGSRLAGSRVDKIHQPERDEIDLVFRLRSGGARLLISSSAGNPRIHFTNIGKENPAHPPMFCMLLRKHLSGAKFAGIRQPGLERILFLDFDCFNEFGDAERQTVGVEIMGRYSNIVLIGENGKIIDAVKHVDETMSRERQILPGLLYEMPPAQNKLSVLEHPPEEIAEKIRLNARGELHKSIIGTVQGVSPVVCRELALRICGDALARCDELTEGQYQRLPTVLGLFAKEVRNADGRPTMVSDSKTRKPIDFSYMDINQYGAAVQKRFFDTYSELLDAFYTERDRLERINQRARDIFSVITSAVERLSRKVENQRQELAESRGREKLKVCGDILSTYLYLLKKGQTECELDNFYDGGRLRIKLDPALTPVQNAQKYYREYRKASVAEKYLVEQIALAQAEIEYLDTVFDELSRAESESGLNEIREELVGQNYLKRHGSKNRRNTGAPSPLKFRSDDGFEILVGRNNRQNDLLTLKTAGKNDLWLHTKNIPGAHVIIFTDGREVPDRTITQAAVLAASHSKARGSAKVPVDYALVRYVKKPTGAKPGMVIYENNRTAYVDPDPELVDRLKV